MEGDGALAHSTELQLAALVLSGIPGNSLYLSV